MTKKRKKLVLNIVFYVALVIIYGFAIFGLVSKFTGGTLYFINTRMDIVLTDSMSVRNKNHLDFLEGTTQIQPLDVVVSDRINDSTELNIKDCVLYNSPSYKYPVVHRIVNITTKGIEFSVANYEKTTFGGVDVTKLDPFTGAISITEIDLSSMEIEVYSPRIYDIFYLIKIGPNTVKNSDLQVTSTKIDENIYKTIIKYERTSDTPYRFKILPGNLDETYISSVTYYTFKSGTMTFNASELDGSKEYSKLFNPYFMYEIRADKASTSDGEFRRSDIISKVTNIIPKVGYFIRIMQSIPVLVCLIGLSIIITVASYFWNKEPKKKKELSDNTNQDIIDNPPNDSNISTENDVSRDDDDINKINKNE